MRFLRPTAMLMAKMILLDLIKIKCRGEDQAVKAKRGNRIDIRDREK
jgi:hypothetical protein